MMPRNTTCLCVADPALHRTRVSVAIPMGASRKKAVLNVICNPNELPATAQNPEKNRLMLRSQRFTAALKTHNRRLPAV
jgi:hypothetical protein